MLKYSDSNLEKKRDLVKAHDATTKAKKMATKRKAEVLAAAAAEGEDSTVAPSESSVSSEPSTAKEAKDNAGQDSVSTHGQFRFCGDSCLLKKYYF